jgi:hypothetical protein
MTQYREDSSGLPQWWIDQHTDPDDNERNVPVNFSNLPAIIGAAATLIGAITALIVALRASSKTKTLANEVHSLPQQQPAPYVPPDPDIPPQ